MRDIRLNDFKSFERCIFDEEERKLPKKKRWAKYYQNEMFIPPIKYPQTIEDYQLDHYALWMVISVFGLRFKPNFSQGSQGIKMPIAWCYACEVAYSRHQSNTPFNCNGCPLKPTKCGAPYHLWIVGVFQRFNAWIVAHYKWIE